MKPTILIAGSLAQRPGDGGHTWVFLQYLLGFKRLGFDVLFLDRLEPDMCRDDAGNSCPVERSVNLRYLRRTMDQFGLADSFSLIFDHNQFFGVDRPTVLRRAARATFLLNVMGFLDDAEILAAVPHRVFLDIDPGFGQMWRATGLHDLFRGHDDFVTIGSNIGRPDCDIPTCGLTWITTPQPIVLDLWPAQPPREDGAFTSIASWRGPFAPIEYAGKNYGLRVHEFRRFFDLPKRTGERFELALDIHPAETRDLHSLRDNGWTLLDPKSVAADTAAYHAFIQRSKAEFMVAKNMYVQANSGWFSDRSICYLASGKPVVAQDTGLRDLYPTDAGLLTFKTVDDAAAAIADVSRDYANHCRAARRIAEEHFDSDKVLRRLLDRLSVPSPSVLRGRGLG